MKKRFISGIWCNECKKQAYTNPCPDCGASHLNHKLFMFAVLDQKFIEVKRKWWNPLTWMGGYWETIGLHSRD